MREIRKINDEISIWADDYGTIEVHLLYGTIKISCQNMDGAIKLSYLLDDDMYYLIR